MNSISLLVMEIWEFVEICLELLIDSLQSNISVTYNSIALFVLFQGIQI